MMNQKTAIILGATGLTGSLLLKRLIADKSYKSIKLFSRKKTGVSATKIKEYIVDMFDLEGSKEDFTADEVYCCIGTTAAKTKDRSVYKAIDYGIPLAAAKLAKENKIPTFMVVSAMGANAKSKIFYNRTKGAMENAVLAQEIQNTYLLRPSLILGDRGESRWAEKLGAFLMEASKILLVGKLKKYRAIQADCIAAAMCALAKSKIKNQIIESNRIQKLGGNCS